MKKCTDVENDLLIEQAHDHLHDGFREKLWLSEEEKTVAHDVIQALNGTSVIRATEILEFCKTAILFQEIK